MNVHVPASNIVTEKFSCNVNLGGGERKFAEVFCVIILTCPLYALYGLWKQSQKLRPSKTVLSQKITSPLPLAPRTEGTWLFWTLPFGNSSLASYMYSHVLPMMNVMGMNVSFKVWTLHFACMVHDLIWIYITKCLHVPPFVIRYAA